MFKDAMENLIGRQLLIQEAEHRDIKIPEAEVAQRAREFQVQGSWRRDDVVHRQRSRSDTARSGARLDGNRKDVR